MQNIKKQLLSQKIVSIFLLLIFSASPLLVFADGKLIIPTPEGFDLADQNYQEAFINYQDGMEKLIIDVDIEKKASEMVWIIPIPANPEKVEIDVLSDLPRIIGQEVNKRAASIMEDDDTYFPLLMTQVHLFPFFIVFVSMGGARELGEAGEADLVTLFTHVEKEGIVSEVLTAKSNEALYNYLSGKGIRVEKDVLLGLDTYFEKEYTFVSSWLSSEKIIEGDRGIYIAFPTEKIYYPLIPTSSYGEREIPIAIRVLDHVKPKVYSEIKSYFETEYYGPPERFGGARRMVDARQIQVALEMHYDMHGAYPNSLKGIDPGILNMDLLLEQSPDFEQAYQVKEQGEEYVFKTVMSKRQEMVFDSTGYYETQEISAPSGRLKDFFGKNEAWKGAGEYTKVIINAPSKNFKKDLWMEPGKPFTVLLASAIVQYPWVVTVLLGIILSFLAGGISGFIIYRKFKKYAVLGLLNILTIIALILVLIKIEKRKRLIFVILFSFLFTTLSILVPKGLSVLIG